MQNEKKEETCSKVSKATYGPCYQDHLLEQFKSYAETTEKVSDRRALANSFFISVVLALISTIGVIVGFGNQANLIIALWGIIISISGIVICYSWYAILESYRQLNSSKFRVICEIEKSLPFQCYSSEWEVLGKEKNMNLYKPLTRIEKYVPIIFIIIFATILGGCIGWIIRMNLGLCS